MLITTLLMATMAPSPTAMVDTTRAAFTKCLRDHMKKSLESKILPAEYDLAIKAACGGERDGFRSAVIALNRSGGDSAADAAENADLQIEDYHANFTEKFNDFSSTGTLPG